ncbi:glycosyltransferase family 4 protein [Anaeromyxobacter oryzae]|uniref:Glycosyltransferase subfamily 4-like N-terminal domain-containing protein n=1 Tax=Anaeromyxobacter oryzae TaxID=2918170 RepID=A0ABM7X3G1_9BACT|nr:glycosyltransferase family 4 protein [Anaeromyxobacter oryzae]BDG06325.1 hypothetical protein AMOR_53210 [Anaeromyxobacter oryzae]
MASPSPTRVLFLAPFPRAGRFPGGITAVANGVRSHLDLAARRGCEFDFFNTEPGERSPADAGKLTAGNLVNALRMAARLRAEQRGKRFDVVYVSSSVRWALLKDLLAIQLIGRRPRCRVVLHVHFAEATKILFDVPLLDRLVVEAMRRSVDDVVFLSGRTRDEFVRIGLPGARTHVVHNFHEVRFGPDALRRKVARARAKDRLELLFMGSLDRRKGILDLLAALVRLGDAPVKLHVCGRPNEAGIDEALASPLAALGDRVAMHGYVSGAAKAELLENADVLVLPSYGEGLPMVLLEAMATGCAVVTTPVGAIPELVVDGDGGLLVAPGDPARLAAAIRTLVDDREKLAAMMETNHAAAARFTSERFMEAICTVCRGPGAPAVGARAVPLAATRAR